jgi:hypothetical protein
VKCKCGRDAMRFKDECGICEILRCQSPPGGTSTGWPMKSKAMGCHSDQVEEGNAFLAENGISHRDAHHESDGQLVLSSAKARKAVLKAKGMTDLNSFN